MGIVESVEDLTETLELEMKDFDETMQDSIFPWFHIVQWSSEDLPTDMVLKWNYKSIKEKVQSLTINKQVFLSNCPISRIENFSLDEDNTSCNLPFAEWAGALLSQLDDLNNIRYELVPGRMSEETFWQSYFNAVRNIIIKDVIPIEKKNGRYVTCKKYKEINENEILEENVPDFYMNEDINELENPNDIENNNELKKLNQINDIVESKLSIQDSCINNIEDNEEENNLNNIHRMNQAKDFNQQSSDHESAEGVVNIDIDHNHDNHSDKILSEEIPINQE